MINILYARFYSIPVLEGIVDRFLPSGTTLKAVTPMTVLVRLRIIVGIELKTF
jgi:hypothetical protein